MGFVQGVNGNFTLLLEWASRCILMLDLITIPTNAKKVHTGTVCLVGTLVL